MLGQQVQSPGFCPLRALVCTYLYDNLDTVEGKKVNSCKWLWITGKITATLCPHPLPSLDLSGNQA
jgi:hypothetical protein